MSEEKLENRKGCNRRVVMFFIFAVLCVAAFLIIGLVKTCNAEHEEREEEKVMEEEVVMLPHSDSLELSSQLG